MRWTSLVLLFLAAPLLAGQAQRSTTGSLVGRVVDAQSGAPLAGTDLYIASRDRRATADSAGNYRFSELAGGVYDLQVRRLGYQQLTMAVSVITGAESESDVRLTRVTTLDTVHTKAAATKYISPGLRDFEQRRKIGVGHFIPEEVMRQNDNRTLGNTLKRIPGVTAASFRSGEYVASSRGCMARSCPQADPSDKSSPRGCWVAVYMDGIATYLGPPDRPPDLNRVLVKDLAAAEFYPGGASVPVQFAGIKASDCGVLLLWTRDR